MIRNKFAASILQSRNMKILAGGINQEDMNEAYFMNFFNLPKRENVVRTLWGSQWDIVKAALHSQKSTQVECARGLSNGRGKGKQSPLNRMFPKKEKAPRRPVAPPAGSDTAIGLEIWSTLNNNKGRDFDPPKPEESGCSMPCSITSPARLTSGKLPSSNSCARKSAIRKAAKLRHSYICHAW